MHDLSPSEKGNTRLMKLLGRLSYEKILRYNNSPPYVMARWPSQQIPPLNFLGRNTKNKDLFCLNDLNTYISFFIQELKPQVVTHLPYQTPNQHRDQLKTPSSKNLTRIRIWKRRLSISVSVIMLCAGCEFDCIAEQNAPHFRHFATQISACIAVFTM